MKCRRCGNVMVYETFLGHDQNYSGWRCISCGEIIDEVIMENRRSGVGRRKWGKTRE
jgi:DNA-directed RNA polymerase subunit RPC12/RpoP